MGHRISGGTLFWSALVLLIAAAAGFFIVGRPGQGPVAGGEPVFSRLPARPAGGPELPQQGAAGAMARALVPALSPAAAIPIEPAPLEIAALQAPVLPEFVPKIKETIERIVGSGVVALPPLSAPPPGSPSAAAIPSGILLTPPPPGVLQPLTEQEVFGLLYPDFYIQYLETIQAELVNQGALPADAVVAFKTESEMMDFIVRMGDLLRNQGLISEEAYQELRRGADAVFRAPYEHKLREAVASREQLSDAFSSFVPIPTREAKLEFLRTSGIIDALGPEAVYSLPAFSELATSSPQSSAYCTTHVAAEHSPRMLSRPLLGVVRILAEVIPFPRPAAAACGPTYCITSPICFMEGAPLPGGYNLPGVPCCSGRICGAPIGCLELCGNGSKPFIWDPTTSICGCG